MANDLLEEWKKETLLELEAKRKVLEELKSEKAESEARRADYERGKTLKKQGLEKMSNSNQDHEERTEKVEQLLAKIILNLERLANLIIPDRPQQLKKVARANAERVLTLCGLTLEQKATILAYRNRSFPIESINDDTTVGTRPSYLRGQAQAAKSKEDTAGPTSGKDNEAVDNDKESKEFQELRKRLLKNGGVSSEGNGEIGIGFFRRAYKHRESRKERERD